MLAGILTPDTGAVHFGGQAINALSDADRSKLHLERFGFVFPQGLLIPELTAVENVALGAMLNGAPKRDADGYAARNSAIRSASAASCSFTRTIAVPPVPVREFTEPSIVSTSRTPGSRCSEIDSSSSSDGS